MKKKANAKNNWDNPKRVVKLVDSHGQSQVQVTVDSSYFDYKIFKNGKAQIWNKMKIQFPLISMFGSDAIEVQVCTNKGVPILSMALPRPVSISPGWQYSFLKKELIFKEIVVLESNALREIL